MHARAWCACACMYACVCVCENANEKRLTVNSARKFYNNIEYITAKQKLPVRLPDWLRMSTTRRYHCKPGVLHCKFVCYFVSD